MHAWQVLSCDQLWHEAGLQMESMGEKLAELEAEREELDRYLQADRDRRSLQFTLWDADLNKTQGDLAKVCRPLMLSALCLTCWA